MTARQLFRRPPFYSPLTILLGIFGAVVFGIGVGLVTAYVPLLLYLAFGATVMCLGSFFMVRHTHWTVAAFFLAFALQTTVFAGFEVRGLYYPLYLLMIVNAVLGLVVGKLKIPPTVIVTYLLFFTVVVLSLFNIATPLDFEVFQRLFIYLLGLIIFFQFSSEQAFQTVLRVQLWAGLIVASWVILDAAQGGFAGRGISEVDQNNVTSTIALGLIPLFALQLFSTSKLWVRTLGWLALGAGIYATLLLASRGISLAIAVAFFVMFARILNNPQRSLPLILVAVIAGLVLAGLPGSSNLIERFNQGDVASANGRVPLWTAALNELQVAPPLQLIFGHGYDYTLLVTNRVVGFLYSVHNTYLQMALDFGLVGVGLFLLLHVVVLFVLWRFDDALSLGSIGTVVFLLFSNLTLQAADGFLYWVALGVALAVAVWRQQGKPIFNLNKKLIR